MEHTAPSPAPPPAGIDPAAAPSPPTPAAIARKPRRSTADYRWTQPKVLAFLAALAQSGRVAEAARVVGMSAWSAYRLRARMGSARFDAAFEGARRSGIRARAEASRAQLAAPAPSRWDGPSLAEMIARERAREAGAHGASPLVHGGAPFAQGDEPGAQSAASPAQTAGFSPQSGDLPRKVPKDSPGLCNTRSKSAPAMGRV